MLQFTNFKKSYGYHTALKIDHFRLPHGIFWVRGVNGSGKSTLLRSIAGILSFEGDIVLHESQSLKKNPTAYRKLVNFAEAEPIFPEFLTGKELVNLFLYTKDAPAKQEEYFIETMKMAPFIDQPLGSYSSGMLKKLSLLLAFIGNPQLILLDEPLITLDVESLDILYQWILLINQQHGTNFILSSHQNLDEGILGMPQKILVEMQTLTMEL